MNALVSCGSAANTLGRAVRTACAGRLNASTSTATQRNLALCEVTMVPRRSGRDTKAEWRVGHGVHRMLADHRGEAQADTGCRREIRAPRTACATCPSPTRHPQCRFSIGETRDTPTCEKGRTRLHGRVGIGMERDSLSREPSREGLDARARTAAASAQRVGSSPFGVGGRQWQAWVIVDSAMPGGKLAWGRFPS